MPKTSARQEKNLLEKIILLVSSILVLASMGWLAWDAVADGDGPPSIVVEVGNIEQRAGRYAARVTARNEGASTAENVRIAVTLEGGSEGQEAELVFNYLPAHASRTGWVTFRNRPGPADRLETYVLGYIEP